MERLTKTITESTIELSGKANPFQYNGSAQRVHVKHPFWNVFNRLRNYEDAEEQGLLLRLPCKVGDKVYSPTRNFVSEYTIESIEVYKEGLYFNWHCDNGIYIKMAGFIREDIGKSVFLTKAEAEKALKEMDAE